MHYKMIAFDMDGTLLKSDKTVSEGTIKALRKASEAGAILAFSTGRPLCEVKPYLDRLPMMHYGILGSGAVVYDFIRGRRLSEKCIPKEVPQAVARIIEGRDIMPHLISDDQVYVNEEQVRTIERYKLTAYRSLYEQTAVFEQDMLSFLTAPGRRFQKINLFHCSSKDREITLHAAASLPVQLTLAEETSLEMTAEGVSKGYGLRKLCEFLDLPLQQVIAVGDGDNDVDIFKAAGLSVAMGNADDGVKKSADCIVSDNDHDGCAEAVERFFFGSLTNSPDPGKSSNVMGDGNDED